MSQDFQTDWRNQRRAIDDNTRVFKTARPLTALIALICWGYIVMSIASGNASRSWPAVIGTVTSSQIVAQQSTSGHSNTTDFQANITYQYDVGGHSFSNNSVNAPFNQTGIFLDGREQSQELVNKYPVGARAVVYFDRSNPSSSCLVPGVNGVMVCLVAIFGVVFTVISLPMSWIRHQTEATYKVALKRGDKGWIVESDSRNRM